MRNSCEVLVYEKQPDLRTNIKKFFHSFGLVNPIFKLEVQIVMILSSRGT